MRTLFERSDEFRVAAFPQRVFPPETLQGELDRLVRSSHGLMQIERVGDSFDGRPIRLARIGSGETSVLLWSQMHGDESTATMATCDIINFLIHTQTETSTRQIVSSLRLLFLPMLNPDGASRFQRRNSQGIDINRDALSLQTPEARLLTKIQNDFRPQFGFNLHDQELSTIGMSIKLTAIAVLAPAFDAARSDNDVRLRAKHVAGVLTAEMNQFVPGLVARYDDAFEPRAFGDYVQQRGTSTILVESGHTFNDPEKDFIRRLNFVGILACLSAIATGEYRKSDVPSYENLPLNGKRAYDVVVRNARIDHGDGKITEADLGISYQVDTHSEPPPKLIDLGDLSTFVGLKEFDAKGKQIPSSELVPGTPFEWERFFSP